MSSKWMVGLAMALACWGAQAVVRASVSIGTPSLHVTDLDRSDGIRAQVLSGGPTLDIFGEMLAPAPVYSEAIGQASFNELESSIIGKTTGRGSSFLAVADRYAPSFTFTLSPRSSVRVVTPYRLDVFAKESSRSGEAGGFASFEMTVLAANDLRYDKVNDYWDYSILNYTVVEDHIGRDGYGPITGWRQRNGALSFTIDNPGSSAAVFAYRGEMVAWGNSPAVAPVPEPGTMGLMLGGIGAVGWYARRRARRDQASASDQMVRAQLQA